MPASPAPAPAPALALRSLNQLREGGHAAGQAYVGGELAAVIGLVVYGVPEPGEAGSGLAVETTDGLEHEQLADIAEAPFGFVAGFAEQLHEAVPLANVGYVSGVLLQERRIGLACEVAVGERELAGRHESGLDDVVDEVGDGASAAGGSEFPVFGTDRLGLGDDASTGEAPGLEGLVEKGVVGRIGEGVHGRSRLSGVASPAKRAHLDLMRNLSISFLLLTVASVACEAPISRSPEVTAELQGVLAASDARAPTADDIELLRAGATSANVEVRVQAVRALGRLERGELIAVIVPALADVEPSVRAEAANALGQAVLRGDPSVVRDTLLVRLGTESDARVRGVIAQTIGRLRTEPATLVADVAARLAADIPDGVAAQTGFAKGFYHLARQPAARGAFPEPALASLRRLMTATSDTSDPVRRVRSTAAAALFASAQATAADADAAVADPHPLVRREGYAGAGAVPSDRLVAFLREGLADTSPIVRYEALRGLGRLPAEEAVCSIIDESTADPDLHVALLAIDRMATCDASAVRVAWLEGTAGTLTAADVGWHRAVHALASLAVLNADRAGRLLPDFVAHPSPFVRAWAARAAAAARDTVTLRMLSDDSVAIVQTAAIDGLARTSGRGVDGPAIRALASDDGELLITATRALEGSSDTSAVPVLLDALDRISARRWDTDRDPRVALLDRVRSLGSARDSARISRYLADFDAVVAGRAADVLESWTGLRPEPRPAPSAPRTLPTPGTLDALDRTMLTFEMADGGRVVLRLRPWDAPTNAERLARLARSGHFDGLTFHRVVPNFVVQGGSPGANEYAGDGPYTRDELGIDGNWRGTVGLSTRGRDTGDAQIYFNLIDNLRLDHNYTILAEVVEGMDVVDRMQEGTRIRSVVVR